MCFQQQVELLAKAAALPAHMKRFRNADVAAVTIPAQVWLLSFRASCNMYYNIRENLAVFLHQPQFQLSHISDN